jgi:hypothetical protein
MTSCDGPTCDRSWKRLPKRGFALTGKGKRYRFCSQRCLELALLAGLGKTWHQSPSGKRDFKAAYWRWYLRRVSHPPWEDWPRPHEDTLRVIAELRDAIRPGQLDRMLAAVSREIRKAAKRAAVPWA